MVCILRVVRGGSESDGTESAGSPEGGHGGSVRFALGHAGAVRVAVFVLAP